MGTKLSPNEVELYRRTDEVLFYLWDPIGVSNTPEARDEYESYLPKVFSMLNSNKQADDIVEYLFDVQTNRMGLSGSRDRIREIVDILSIYREWIPEKNL